jgi:[acyl-carrier-protein] S-malonyltransferase
MSFALVFSGQGHQHPAMLPWLAEDEVVRATSSRLGTADWRAAASDPAWAERNDIAQVLLTGLALAAWRQLAPRLPAPAAVAGCSVGEIAAFSAAGVFNVSNALRLAGTRAVAMDRCAEALPGGLLGVSGIAADAVEQACARDGLAVAIRNGPDSLVVGGPRLALDAAEARLRDKGARCTRLRVGVASHTPLMEAAARDFAHALSQERLGAPRIALFSNAADRIRDTAQARHALSAQIATTVRWDECMEGLRSRGVSCMLEVGPGQALARLWNERYPDAPARSCDEFRSAEGIVRWVRAQSLDAAGSGS